MPDDTDAIEERTRMRTCKRMVHAHAHTRGWAAGRRAVRCEQNAGADRPDQRAVAVGVLSAIAYRLSAIRYRLYTIGYMLSAVDCRL